MPDKYDEHIERLVAEPENTFHEWSFVGKASSLFGYCQSIPTSGKNCGCLTQVHSGILFACTPSLTEKIVTDDRIHDNAIELRNALSATNDLDERRRILSVYADYQRDMDDTIRQGKPWVANRSRIPETAP